MTGTPASRASLRPSLLLAGCALLAGPSAALADTRTEVRVSGGVGAENNPFLADEQSDEGAVLTAELQVDPSIYITDERTTFRLYGNFRLRQFFEDYGTDVSALLGANGTTQIDERTRLTGGATFQSSRSAAQDAFLLGDQDLIGLEPGTLPNLPTIDPTIPGSRQRFTTYGANGTVERQFSPTDAGSIGFAFTESQTSGDVGFDYRVADLSLGYGRQLSERTTLRGTVVVSRSDLIDMAAGDAFSVTPLVGITQQISERLNWTAQVGLSYAQVDDGLGDEVTSTTLAFSASGCRRDPRGALCFTAERQPRPTTFGGFSNSTGFTIGYDAAVNRRDTVSLNATYRRSDQIAVMEAPGMQQSGTDELIGVGVGYRREFTTRLSGFANAAYSRVTSDLFPDRDANIRGFIGVSYVFGRQR